MKSYMENIYMYNLTMCVLMIKKSWFDDLWDRGQNFSSALKNFSRVMMSRSIITKLQTNVQKIISTA